MFDIVSYILGKKMSSGDVTVIDENFDYTFADDGNGNITITEGE